MIDHFLDRYDMDIEFDSEKLRNSFHTVGAPGKPLQSAVFHRHSPAISTLIARGAQPAPAIFGTIGGLKFVEGYLPAFRPILDAGADLGEVYDWAVRLGNTQTARICLERGTDLMRVPGE